MNHAVKKGLVVSLALMCASQMMISCAKTFKDDNLTQVEHQDIPEATQDDFNNPATCEAYYKGWKESEYELQKAYLKSDKIYNECD